MTDQDQNKQAEIIQLADDITKEQVINLLKEKSKEVNKINAKLGKLESKYIQTFKENKNYKKDCETFIKLLKQIFNEENCKFIEKQFGEYEYSELAELFDKKEKDRSQSLAKIINDFNIEKQILNEKIQYQLNEQLQQKDNSNQLQVLNLKKQYADLEQTNMKLSKEIVELNQLVKKKNVEITELKKIDQQFQALKAELLIKELQSNKQKAIQTNNINTCIKESELTDQILQLRSEKDQLMDQMVQFKKENEELKKNFIEITQHKQITSNNNEVITQNLGNSSNAQINGGNEEKQKEQVGKQNLKETEELKDQECQVDQMLIGQQIKPELQVSPSFSKKNSNPILQHQKSCQLEDSSPAIRESINFQYLKNVMLKYFIYNESGNYKEAYLLMNVMLNIMKLSAEEKKSVEEARNQYSIWGQTKNYLSDKLLQRNHAQNSILISSDLNNSSLTKQNSSQINSNTNLDQKTSLLQ